MISLKKAFDSKGFSHIELMLGIIILVAIAGVAYLGLSKASTNNSGALVADFQALTQTSNTMLLSWMNKTSSNPTYIISRDGKEIARTKENVYLDTNLAPGTYYTYTVAVDTSSSDQASSDSNQNAVSQKGTLTMYTLIKTANHLNANDSVCTPIGAYPKPPAGTLADSIWYFDSNDVNNLAFDVEIHNDPGAKSELYLQLYEAYIDNTPEYFGLQSNGTFIFDRFGDLNLADIKTGPGSTKVSGSNEGKYISLRYKLPGDLGVGNYVVQVYRSTTNNKDWFIFNVEAPGGKIYYVGRILFPRSNPSKAASFQPEGDTWVEDYQNNNPKTLYTVPNWSVNVMAVANLSLDPVNSYVYYDKMPDSEVRPVGGMPYTGLNFVIGPQVQKRCNSGGLIWN